jgi:hypothetical protein
MRLYPQVGRASVATRRRARPDLTPQRRSDLGAAPTASASAASNAARVALRTIEHLPGESQLSKVV